MLSKTLLICFKGCLVRLLACRVRQLCSAGFLLGVVAIVLLARPFQQPTSMRGLDIPRIFPPAPLVYLESSNFLGQLQRWDQSKIKEDWLQSDNYKQFENSRLYLRLGDKLREFEKVAELTVNLPLVESLAGGRAALGLYSIGDLEFLFVTHIGSSGFEQGPFFAQHAKYEQKTAEGGPYFSKSGHGHAIAYALRQDYFFLATSEMLLRTALHNFADSASNQRLKASDLFQQSAALLPNTGDFWMLLNMAEINQSRYFRNEWIHHNLDQTSRFQAGVVRLDMGSQQIEEQRRFLFREERGASLPGESERKALDEALLESLSGDLEFVHAEMSSPESIAGLIYSTLLNPVRAKDKTLSLTRSDSAYPVAPLLKTDNRYFLQIDEPVSVKENPETIKEREQAALLERLTTALTQSAALGVVHCESHAMSAQGYYQPQLAYVLKLEEKSLNGLKEVLEGQFNRLNHLAQAARWKRLDGNLESLGAFPSLALGYRAPLAFLGNSEILVRQLMLHPAPLPDAVPQGLRSYSRLDVEKFRPGYQALFAWLDYQQRPRGPGEAPAYFSRNLGSLMAALSPIQSISVKTWEVKNTLNEEVIYRLR